MDASAIGAGAAFAKRFIMFGGGAISGDSHIAGVGAGASLSGGKDVGVPTAMLPSSGKLLPYIKYR